MEIFKIKLENYNDDVPALEFGCFSDDQMRLIIALLKSQLREINEDLIGIGYEIDNLGCELKIAEHKALKGRDYKGEAMLETISNEEVRDIIRRIKNLKRTQITFRYNRQKVESTYNRFKELADYLHSLNPNADKDYYRTTGFMGNNNDAIYID